MAKIQMTTPLVEMDGDEMTRVLWQWIKDILLTPYVDLKTEYYDLGLEHREKTKDQVTIDSANATKKYGVAVKCATITPNAARMPEYNLSQMWKSPNGTIRAILDGTVFRTPILVKGVEPYIPTWTAPITIARHAYGDVYKNTEMKVKKGSKAELVVTDAEGNESRELIFNFEDTDGIVQGLHNKNNSIAGFARACFNYGLDLHQDVWFATKDTISKKYDHTFKDIFQEIYDNANTTKITPQNLTQTTWDTINTMVGDGTAFAYYGPLYSATYVAGAVDKTPEQFAEDVGFAVFPVSEYNDTPFCIAAPQGMGINATTQYPEICKDLFRELYSGDSIDQLAHHADTIFTLSSVKAANEMEDIKTNPILEKVGYMADLSVTPPNVDGLTTYNNELYKQIQLLELGQTTPEQAVADMKTQIEINLDADLVEYK